LINKIVIGSRGSELALWQTNWVITNLQNLFPSIEIEIKIIHTEGDKILDVALSKIGDKGLFTKAIEQALIDKTIDMAVHSLKDLPTILPEGLIIGAFSIREDQRDAFISNKYSSIEQLPDCSVIATGSLRRSSQLLNFNQTFRIVDIRGNVQTRLKKFNELGYDAMILAYAGLKRLKLNEIVKQIISPELMLPAVSQGIMGVEIRNNDKEIFDIIQKLNNTESECEAIAERSFLNTLEGGCQIPVGVYSSINDEILKLNGMIASLDGKQIVKDFLAGDVKEAEFLGKSLAQKLLSQGGDKILSSIRNISN
jgi:hydroxymethylbilane synthase